MNKFNSDDYLIARLKEKNILCGVLVNAPRSTGYRELFLFQEWFDISKLNDYLRNSKRLDLLTRYTVVYETEEQWLLRMNSETN
jgi:hypothetical protein